MGTEKIEETTLDLDQVMVEGMDKFQGELIEAAREDSQSAERRAQSAEEKADTSITPKPADAESPPGEAQGAESKAQGAEEAEEAGTQGKDEGETPAEEKPEKKDFRFKSQDEAESGYRHLQAAKTRVEQEAARLRTELKKAQDAEKERGAQETRDQVLLDFMADEHEKALDQIDELDPEDDGYRKAVARIWAKKDSAIEVKRRAQSAESRAQSAESEAQGVKDLADAGTQVPEQSKVWEFVEGRARGAKIDPEDDYFRMVCTYAPTEGPDGQKLSFEDQVDWAVQQTTDYHKKQEQRFQEGLKTDAEKQSEAHQAANLPLGRSPADRTVGKPEPPRVVTLDDALEGVLEERRL